MHVSAEAVGKKREDENLQANRPTAADQLSADKKISRILVENTASPRVVADEKNFWKPFKDKGLLSKNS